MIITNQESERVKSVFLLLIRCKFEVKDDSFLQPLLVSLSHWIDAFQVRDPNTASVTEKILHIMTRCEFIRPVQFRNVEVLGCTVCSILQILRLQQKKSEMFNIFRGNILT